MSCASIAKVVFLDNDTIRTWYQLYREEGIEGLANFGHEGGTCRLTVAQQDRLKAWIAQTLPRTTRQVGAWIGSECGIDYQSRSGLIALARIVWAWNTARQKRSRASSTRQSRPPLSRPMTLC